jgi:phosphate starvation-inducible membrane PsiE
MKYLDNILNNDSSYYIIDSVLLFLLLFQFKNLYYQYHMKLNNTMVYGIITGP